MQSWTRGEAPTEKQVADLFEETVLQLNRLNGADDVWWLTWISNYDRFRGRLLDRLAAGFGLAVQTPLPGAWQDRLALAKTAARAVRRRLAARKARARTAGGHDVILVSILNTRKLAAVDDYVDEYFGRLPDWIARRGLKPLVVGFNEGDDFAAASLAALPRPFPVETVFNYLGMSDILSATVSALFHRFRSLPHDSARRPEVDRAIADEVRHQRPAILEGLLIRRAMERVLAINPDAAVIHMFENNAWERAAYLAAGKADPPRPVTGYLHCAVLKSHRKFRFPVEEHGIRPMPARIVLTGPAAARALADMGSYPPGMIVEDGVALRDQMSDEQPAPVSGPGRNVLLLLEGLPSISSMLDLVGEAARLGSGYRFTLRCHPQLPYDRAIDLMKEPATGRRWLQPNEAESLSAAIDGADVIVYSSSTAVYAALSAGKPLIFIPTDRYFNNDALFHAEGLARRAETPHALLAALDEIERLTPEQRRLMAISGREFCRKVMKPATPDCVDLFLT